MSKFKVGAKVRRIGPNQYGDLYGVIGSVYEVTDVRGNVIWVSGIPLGCEPSKFELVEPTQNFVGGPSDYYDMPYKDWVTTNDQMEYLSKNKWGEYSIHLKDIFKGLCRWGDKDGTTVEYDTRKVIYYGVRVLKMVVGTEQTRRYLQSLLDDKQFKG